MPFCRIVMIYLIFYHRRRHLTIRIFVSHVHDTRPKRHQCQLCQLKLLQSKRDPDDRDTQQTADREVLYGKRNARDQDPYYVYDEGGSSAAIDDLLAKRKKGHRREFKALDAIGDPDDRDAPQTTREHPAEPADTTPKDKP